MKPVLATCLFFTLCTIANAADSIHMYDGRIVNCKVTSITLDHVFAIVSNDSSSFEQQFTKTEIKAIVFADGHVETFAQVQTQKSTDEKVLQLERQMHKSQVNNSKGSGILIGIGVCVGIVLLLALV
ncbi:hypothetical protein IT157_00615 [bacterium]|nr:hypothetical protein [bacterium]